MLDILIALLVFLPVISIWASYKLWKWHKFYGTRFLWGLFLASVATDLAATPIALIALYHLLVPNGDGIPGAPVLLGISIAVLESIFIYLVLRWGDLDEDMKRVRTGSEDETSHTNLAPEEHD